VRSEPMMVHTVFFLIFFFGRGNIEDDFSVLLMK
jgi:hypothetical protein